MIKRILSLLTAAALLLAVCAFGASAAETTVVTVGPAACAPGSEVQVPVTVSGANVASLQIRLTYDTNYIQYESYAAGVDYANGLLEASESGSGSLVIGYVNADDNPPTDITLLTLTFLVASDAPESLTLTPVVEACDSPEFDANTLSVTPRDCQIANGIISVSGDVVSQVVFDKLTAENSASAQAETGSDTSSAAGGVVSVAGSSDSGLSTKNVIAIICIAAAVLAVAAVIVVAVTLSRKKKAAENAPVEHVVVDEATAGKLRAQREEQKAQQTAENPQDQAPASAPETPQENKPSENPEEPDSTEQK